MVRLCATVSCLDIGNTISHFGRYKNGTLVSEESVPTAILVENKIEILESLEFEKKRISYCSVVPKAEKALLEYSKLNNIELFNLDHNSCGNFPINYPNPCEIGQDRIANSIAAFHTIELPCIVIDVGTATTFDIISPQGGYEGGVITPGPQGLLDFLNQNTALLPTVKADQESLHSAIGKNTKDAMLIGSKIGYKSMTLGILVKLIDEIEELLGKKPTIVKTGGGSSKLAIKNCLHHPDLTLLGLALAFQLNSPII